MEITMSQFLAAVGNKAHDEKIQLFDTVILQWHIQGETYEIHNPNMGGCSYHCQPSIQ